MEWVLAVMAIAVVATVEAARRDAPWGAVAKMVASTLLLVIAWSWGALDTRYGTIIFVALAFSWCGDGLLIGKDKRFFLAGLGAFLIAHAVYAVAFVTGGLRWMFVAFAVPVAVLLFLAVAKWLLPHAGRLKIPVVVYMATILIMVSAAFAAAWVIFAGAVLFAISDLFVARQRFIQPHWVNRGLGLPLYYMAQVLLASSVL